VRRTLDAIYTAAGALAALCIAAIAGLVFAQVCLNLADKTVAAATGAALGLTIPSYSDITGYLLAAASFLALAYTLRAGGHIRVTLAIRLLPARARRAVETAVTAVALAMSGYATWFMVGLVRESAAFGDRTAGMVSLPLWAVQAPVAVGLAVLTVALADELAGAVRGRAPSWQGRGENLLGGEGE